MAQGSEESTEALVIRDDDTPLMREYLGCFGEIVHLVNSNQDVPDDLWQRIRDAWEAMTPSEREAVELRTPKGPQ